MYVYNIIQYILSLFVFRDREFYAKIIEIYDIMNVKLKYKFFYYNYILADIYIPEYIDKLCIEWVLNHMIIYMKNKVFRIQIIHNKSIHIHDTYNNLYVNNWINNLIIEYTINKNLYQLNKSNTI